MTSIQEKAFRNTAYKMAAILFGPQYVNSMRPREAYMRQYLVLSLVQIMACHLFGAKPLPESMIGYC